MEDRITFRGLFHMADNHSPLNAVWSDQKSDLRRQVTHIAEYLSIDTKHDLLLIRLLLRNVLLS